MKIEEKIDKLELTGKNDSIFKAIMLDHPNILKAVLETLMQKTIGEFKILNPELTKQQFIEKGKHLDIYLETEEEYIDVEVSTEYNKMIENRNLSYICHVFCQTIKKGESYKEYKKSSIYNIIWNKKSKYIYRTGRLTDEYGNIISDMITYNMVHMDKIMERYYNKDEEFIKKNKYLIMLGLNIEELEELIEITKGDEIVEEYREALIGRTDDYELPMYVSKERDEQMMRDGIRQEALEQGLQEGIEKGLQQGIEMVARNFLKQGLDLESISKATGLSIKQLSKLSN